MKTYDAQGNLIDSTTISQIQRKLAFSTTTPLGASAVYTSPTISDALSYRRIVLMVYSDQSITVHGEHSLDGIAWRRGTGSSTAANTASIIDIVLSTPFFRVVLINGATPTTVLQSAGYLSPLT